MGNRRSLEVNVGVSGFWWGAVVVVQTRLRFDVRGVGPRSSFCGLGGFISQRLRWWASTLSRTSSVSFSSGVSWRFSIRVGSRASLPPRQAAPRHGEETMSLRRGRRKRTGLRRGSPGDVDRGLPGDVDRGDRGNVDRGGGRPRLARSVTEFAGRPRARRGCGCGSGTPRMSGSPAPR